MLSCPHITRFTSKSCFQHPSRANIATMSIHNPDLSLHPYCDHLPLGQVRSCFNYLPRLLVSLPPLKTSLWFIFNLAVKMPLKV